jgi:hypothetical protein
MSFGDQTVISHCPKRCSVRRLALLAMEPDETAPMTAPTDKRPVMALCRVVLSSHTPLVQVPNRL